MICITFDPGKTTGYAVWNDAVGLKEAGQMDEREFRWWLHVQIQNCAVWDLHVVGEKYTITMETVRKQADAHWALDVLGAAYHLCDIYGLELERQAPSKAKAFATDAKLRKLGWYQATPGGHRNDAVRHLVVWLVDHQLLPLRSLA